MRNDELYLRHMMDAINRIEGYVSVGHERFLHETHWQDAVIGQLEIIGEATKRPSPEHQARHTEIQWRRLAGLRDVLIHNDMGVDLDAVWGITQQPLADLKQQLARMMVTGNDTEP